MSNPFEQIDARLTSIESLLREFKNGGAAIPALLDVEKPITVKELCAFLGVTESTVIRWRAKKVIPFMQLGSRVLFNKTAVLKALENKKGAAK